MGAPDDWILIDLLPSVGRALWADTEDTVVVRSGYNSYLARADDAEFRAMPAVPAELPLLTLESDASVDGLRGISPSEVFVALNDWKPQEYACGGGLVLWFDGETLHGSSLDPRDWTEPTKAGTESASRLNSGGQTCPEGVVS